MAENKEIKTKNYTLRTENGAWLGQIVLTSDGMFASVTDYGNLSYSWRSYGSEQDNDFRSFLCSLNTQYFGGKMYSGISYISYGKKFEKACERYAEMILPALQKVLKEELEQNIGW